jgi:hypothetical protein
VRPTQCLYPGDGVSSPDAATPRLPRPEPLCAETPTGEPGSTVSSPPILANVPAPPCAWMLVQLPLVGTALQWPPAFSTPFSCLSYNRRQRLVPSASTAYLPLWLNNAPPTYLPTYQGTECEYRHSQAILLRLQRGQAVATCPAWSGDGCSNVACPWRHPINNTGVSASVRETIDEHTTACRCLPSRCSPVSRLHACEVLARQFLLLIHASIVFACPATPMSVPRFACPGHTVRVFVCVSPCVCSPVGTSLWASAPRVLPAPSPMTDQV